MRTGGGFQKHGGGDLTENQEQRAEGYLMWCALYVDNTGTEMEGGEGDMFHWDTMMLTCSILR